MTGASKENLRNYGFGNILKQEPCENLPEAHLAISDSDPGMNSEQPKEPLTERSETLSAHRQTTDKLRTRPSNGAYFQH